MKPETKFWLTLAIVDVALLAFNIYAVAVLHWPKVEWFCPLQERMKQLGL